MNRLIVLILALIITISVTDVVSAQIYNFSNLTLPNTGIRYNIFSNSINYNSQYLNLHKNLGNTSLSRYMRYKPYMYGNNYLYSINRYMPYRYGYNYIPYNRYVNPNINIPLKRYGNTNMSIQTRNFIPQRLNIYSY